MAESFLVNVELRICPWCGRRFWASVDAVAHHVLCGDEPVISDGTVQS